jgi:hypothetical protein
MVGMPVSLPFTEADIKLAAGARPFERGLNYLSAVQDLEISDGRIASILLSARACHQALGTTDEFRRYMAALRTEQKRKRNLMKILDQNGL